jgi:type I restriction enzyme S subunit
MSDNVPAIRFVGFAEPWEQRQLGEVAQFNPVSDLPSEFEYVDLESVVGTEMIGHRHETRESAPSRAQRLARAGDIFYQAVRPYQKNNYLYEKPDEGYVFSTGYVQMRPHVNGSFLFSTLQRDSFVDEVLNHCTGTSYPAINSNDLANIVVSIPSDEREQALIGNAIRTLDNLITLHQCKPGCTLHA